MTASVTDLPTAGAWQAVLRDYRTDEASAVAALRAA
jgi:hypothetical protein